jgi:predicted transcriptional regulator
MSDPMNMTLAEVTSEVVAAYVRQNHVQPSELPNLIASVHAALGGLGKPVEPTVSAEPPKPAVPVRKSITDEYIISLEDGRKLKSMKRYLAGLGMTPADYRAKWGLPNDYPMVAPAYAAKRSELAKSLGLGRRSAQDTVETEAEEVDEVGPEVEAEPEPEAPRKAGRGRKKA